MRKILLLLIAIVALCSAAEQAIPTQLRGKWVVKRVLPTSTISCWSEEEGKKLIGTEIEYSADSFRWRDQLVMRPSVKVRRITSQQFHDEYSGGGANSSQISFSQLGIRRRSATQIELCHAPASLTGATGEIPGDNVLIKDANMLVFSVCNVYFEARRVSSESRPSQ